MKSFLVLSSVILAVIAAPPSEGDKSKRHLFENYMYNTIPQTYYAPSYYPSYPIQSKVALPEPVLLNTPEQVVLKTPQPVVLKAPEHVVLNTPQSIVLKAPEPVLISHQPEHVLLKETKPVVIAPTEQVVIRPTEQVVIRPTEQVVLGSQHFYPQLVDPVYTTDLVSSRVIVH